MKLLNRFALIVGFALFISACGQSAVPDQSKPEEPQLPAPLMLDYMVPAGEIEIGEVAVIVLDEPMSWSMQNNSPEIVELQPAIDDGEMQTNFAVTAIALGTANLYAEKDGLGQSFTIEVVAKKSSKTLQIGDSEFSVSLPGFLADKIEFVASRDEYTEQFDAINANFIYYLSEDKQQMFGSFAWVLPVSKWEEIQNPNEPPLGEEMLRVNDMVLVISGPQDLPFNDRYSNDATRYSALATLLDRPETYSYTP
jgi:hypothetical protein